MTFEVRCVMKMWRAKLGFLLEQIVCAGSALAPQINIACNVRDPEKPSCPPLCRLYRFYVPGNTLHFRVGVCACAGLDLLGEELQGTVVDSPKLDGGLFRAPGADTPRPHHGRLLLLLHHQVRAWGRALEVVGCISFFLPPFAILHLARELRHGAGRTRVRVLLKDLHVSAGRVVLLKDTPIPREACGAIVAVSTRWEVAIFVFGSQDNC